jgi:hypothetical protein
VLTSPQGLGYLRKCLRVADVESNMIVKDCEEVFSREKMRQDEKEDGSAKKKIKIWVKYQFMKSVPPTSCVFSTHVCNKFKYYLARSYICSIRISRGAKVQKSRYESTVNGSVLETERVLSCALRLILLHLRTSLRKSAQFFWHSHAVCVCVLCCVCVC